MDPLASCNDTRHIEMFSEFCLKHPEEKQCFPEQMQDMSTPAGYDDSVRVHSQTNYIYSNEGRGVHEMSTLIDKFGKFY